MWYKPSLSKPLDYTLRHECSYNDHLPAFGWTKHDGQGYATQTLSDPENHVVLETQWVKLSSRNWALRVHGKGVDEDVKRSDLSLLWYVATPGNLTATYNYNSTDSIPRIEGNQPDRGPYHVWMEPSTSNHHPTYRGLSRNQSVTYDSTYFNAIRVDSSVFYNPKPFLIQELRDPTSILPPHLFDPASLYRAATARTGNQVVNQVFYQLPFTVDIHFAYVAKETDEKDLPHNVTRALGEADRVYSERFHSVFVAPNAPSLHHGPYDDDHEGRVARSLGITETKNWTHDQLRTAQYALGNLLGSATFMHGDRQLYIVENDTIISTEPTSMLVMVPDRPDHAQGYLWDEGFQQHLVSLWDLNTTLQVLTSWWNQTDDQGWIARQQILGDEVRWSAKPTSWLQFPGTANPPSHHLILERLLERHEKDRRIPSHFLHFLHTIWSHLKRNVDWYLVSQQSKIGANLFRWAGRTPSYCLPSGMDDYPRAPVLTDMEAHLDLQVWMIVSTRSIAKVATILNKTKDAAFYQEKSLQITQALLDHFWDKDREIFDEFYLDASGTKVFDGHLGYLNFWPVFLDALDSDSKQFATVVRKLLDRDNGIWTEFGLRSLSSNDPYFEQGDNYWTGPIWMNINYLVVSSMHKFVTEPEEYPMGNKLREDLGDTYQELRSNLINMVVSNFVNNGFIWEVYDGDTGRGFNNHPFTGWSALIVNIMAELY